MIHVKTSDRTISTSFLLMPCKITPHSYLTMLTGAFYLIDNFRLWQRRTKYALNREREVSLGTENRLSLLLSWPAEGLKSGIGHNIYRETGPIKPEAKYARRRPGSRERDGIFYGTEMLRIYQNGHVLFVGKRWSADMVPKKNGLNIYRQHRRR